MITFEWRMITYFKSLKWPYSFYHNKTTKDLFRLLVLHYRQNTMTSRRYCKFLLHLCWQHYLFKGIDIKLNTLLQILKWICSDELIIVIPHSLFAGFSWWTGDNQTHVKPLVDTLWQVTLTFIIGISSPRRGRVRKFEI